MNLVKLDKSNTQRFLIKKAFVTIDPKAGTIRFNRSAAERITLKAGDHVAMLYDQDKPENWYVAKDTNGYQLRNESNGALIFTSKVITSKFVSVLNIESCTHQIPVGEVKDGMLTLITKATNSIK